MSLVGREESSKLAHSLFSGNKTFGIYPTSTLPLSFLNIGIKNNWVRIRQIIQQGRPLLFVSKFVHNNHRQDDQSDKLNRFVTT